MIKIVFALYGILLWGTGFSQGWEPLSAEAFKVVIEKSSAQNNRENYSMEFKRQVYANATDAQPISSTWGKLLRGKGKEYRMETENQLLVQNKDVKMVIDSTEKLILLMKPDTLFDQVSPEQMFAGQDFMSSSYFLQKAGNTNRYRIDFAEGASLYKRMEFSLDAKTSVVVRIEFILVPGNYMSTDFEDTSEEEPKIIVEYKPAVALKAGITYFSLDPWLKRSGDQYELRPQIPFILDDLRIN